MLSAKISAITGEPVNIRAKDIQSLVTALRNTIAETSLTPPYIIYCCRHYLYIMNSNNNEKIRIHATDDTLYQLIYYICPTNEINKI